MRLFIPNGLRRNHENPKGVCTCVCPRKHACASVHTCICIVVKNTIYHVTKRSILCTCLFVLLTVAFSLKSLYMRLGELVTVRKMICLSLQCEIINNCNIQMPWSWKAEIRSAIRHVILHSLSRKHGFPPYFKILKMISSKIPGTD